jgi:hypothetical protein
VSERALPYHCPYCGGENLRPHEPPDGASVPPAVRGAWECRECTRVFTVKLIGLVVSR